MQSSIGSQRGGASPIPRSGRPEDRTGRLAQVETRGRPRRDGHRLQVPKTHIPPFHGHGFAVASQIHVTPPRRGVTPSWSASRKRMGASHPWARCKRRPAYGICWAQPWRRRIAAHAAAAPGDGIGPARKSAGARFPAPGDRQQLVEVRSRTATGSPAVSSRPSRRARPHRAAAGAGPALAHSSDLPLC